MVIPLATAKFSDEIIPSPRRYYKIYWNAVGHVWYVRCVRERFIYLYVNIYFVILINLAFELPGTVRIFNQSYKYSGFLLHLL